MSNLYKKVKKYYDEGKWTIGQVRDAVAHARITEDQFKEITGIDY